VASFSTGYATVYKLPLLAKVCLRATTEEGPWRSALDGVPIVLANHGGQAGFDRRCPSQLIRGIAVGRRGGRRARPEVYVERPGPSAASHGRWPQSARPLAAQSGADRSALPWAFGQAEREAGVRKVIELSAKELPSPMIATGIARFSESAGRWIRWIGNSRAVEYYGLSPYFSLVRTVFFGRRATV